LFTFVFFLKMDLKVNKNFKSFPQFSQPKLIGAFSVDSERKYHSTLQNLKYLKIPKVVNFNLNEGDRDYVSKPDNLDERLHHLLLFIQNNPSTIKNGQVDADFVCFRGLLRMIMCTPYENRDSWIVLASKFKGTIYLCAEETPQKKAQKLRETERDKMFQRYGFKFESYILSEHPNKPASGSSKPVIESEEFGCMFSVSIDGIKILFGAEMDGIICDKEIKDPVDLQKVQFAEVKVKRREDNERQLTNFYKFKGRNWWCQSFLVGIQKVHAGLRNDKGIVDQIKTYQIKELANEAKNRNYWHATVCANFLSDFLRKVRTDMNIINDSETIFRYSYDPHHSNTITCAKVNKQTFLNSHFVNYLSNL
jgi:RAT1-interacting protein